MLLQLFKNRNEELRKALQMKASSVKLHYSCWETARLNEGMIKVICFFKAKEKATTCTAADATNSTDNSSMTIVRVILAKIIMNASFCYMFLMHRLSNILFFQLNKVMYCSEC